MSSNFMISKPHLDKTCRWSRTVTLFAAILVLLLLPVGASAQVTITQSPQTVLYGKEAVITGSVSAEYVTPETQLRLQIKQRGVWRNAGDVIGVDETGAWRTTFKPLANSSFRVLINGAGPAAGAEDSVAVKPIIRPLKRKGAVLPFLGTTLNYRVVPNNYPKARVKADVFVNKRKIDTVYTKVGKNGLISFKAPTNGVGAYRVRLTLPENQRFSESFDQRQRFVVRGKRVAPGAKGAWVEAVNAALAYRGVYVPKNRKVFDRKLGDSVVAFHKAYGRKRTTTFEASDWRVLSARPISVKSKKKGTHIEVDKSRQILMQVTNGKPTMVIHVSTGRSGNTPVGTHRIQWKGEWVPSLFNSMLYKSMAFQGTFAIHGYPDVPTSPASAGCVRVPMWIAAALYARSPVNMPVLVYA